MFTLEELSERLQRGGGRDGLGRNFHTVVVHKALIDKKYMRGLMCTSIIQFIGCLS